MEIFKCKLTRGLSLSLLALALLGLLTPALGSPPDKSLVLASPDHPPVWYVYNYDKMGQYLQWDERNESLVARVTYSLMPAVNDWSPEDYRTFTLHFPDVKLDAVENTLYFRDDHNRKIILGRLESGILGKHVELGKGIELSAHRHHGTLDGALLVKRTASP